MITFLMKFFGDESGAVTVDFVVLCAAAASLAIAVGTLIADQLDTSSEEIGVIVSDAIDAVKP